MARTNNETVGTMNCADCGTVASLHETRRGKGRGLLYKRCGCGCDQRAGAAVQKAWRQAMTPRPGFEHLSEAADEPAPITEPEPAEPAQATEPAPEERPETAHVKPVKGAGAMPMVAGLFGLGLLLLTLGRAGAGPMS